MIKNCTVCNLQPAVKMEGLGEPVCECFKCRNQVSCQPSFIKEKHTCGLPNEEETEDIGVVFGRGPNIRNPFERDVLAEGEENTQRLI